MGKVITEQILRDELRARQPEYYEVPEGKIVSPAAREYLLQRKIKIILPENPNRRYPARRGEVFAENFKNKEVSPAKHDVVATPLVQPPLVTPQASVQGAPIMQSQPSACVPPTTPSVSPTIESKPKPACAPGRYIDYETGAFYAEKPEHMTQLHGNYLVGKDSPRILFRGKLDSMQGYLVFAQTLIQEAGGSQKLLDDMDNVLHILRELMRCDVMDEQMAECPIIGLSHAEIRDRSHHPLKYFDVQYMVLPEYKHGKIFAILNMLRAQVREVEVAATTAYKIGQQYHHNDIIQTLNRLSSVFHIMMCKYLSGQYN